MLAFAVLAAAPAFAAGADAIDDPSLDPGACRAAAAAALDPARVIAACSPVIEARDIDKPDRIQALLARADAYRRDRQIERAIADHDDALRLDPRQPDVLNARGELRLGAGDRRGALADFAAALQVRPDHLAARANHKALAREVERLGAHQAVAGKPSFDCARARRPVARAICADPALADLDRVIEAIHLRVLRDNAGRPAELRRLKREHAAYLARRDAEFGRPGYDLAAALRARRQQLTGIDGY